MLALCQAFIAHVLKFDGVGLGGPQVVLTDNEIIIVSDPFTVPLAVY